MDNTKKFSLRKVTIIATSGGFLDGYSLMIMNAALLLLIPEFEMSSSTEGIVTALPFLGMVIGSLVAGTLTDRFGRRIVFIVDIIVFFAASVFLGFSQNLFEIAILRFMVGVAIGADMPTSSSMLAEFSPNKIRGAVTSFMNTAWLIGIFISGLIGYILYHIGGPEMWRWMLASPAIPALLIMIFRRDLPESPSWLRSAGRVDEAIEVEKKVPSSANNSSYVTVNKRRGRFSDIFKKGHWKPVLFFTLYLTLSSFAGSPLLSYSSVIFNKVVKFSGSNALLLTVILSALYIIFSLIVQFTVLETRGRKTVALWTTGLTVVGAVATVLTTNITPILVISYTVAIVAIQVGVLPFWPWSVELLPSHIRATGQSIGNAGAKSGSFIGTLFLPSVIAIFGLKISFILVAALFAISFLMVAIFGKETNDRSLNNIETNPMKN